MTGRDDAKAAVLGRIREGWRRHPGGCPRDYDCESLAVVAMSSVRGNRRRYQAVLRIDAASVAATIASLVPSHNGRPTAP
jgi:hypothetical protein